MVKLYEKIGYGFGDMASSMFWKLFGAYLAVFYTDVFGISAAVVGTLFVVTRVWDTMVDPIVGIVADRTETKWGKFRPFLLWLAVPFGVLGMLTFCTPDLGNTGKIIYAFVTYTLMMVVYSSINVPYASLLGVMSPVPAERNSLSTFRMSFAYLGSFAALFFFMTVVEKFGGRADMPVEQQQTAWMSAAGLFAAACVVLFLLCFLLTRERVKQIKVEHSSLKDDFNDLFHNRPWWILLGAGIAALIFNSVRDGATVYYFKYFVLEDSLKNVTMFGYNVSDITIFGEPIFTAFKLSAVYLGLGQLANIIGVVAAGPISNVIGKKNTFLMAMLIASVLSVIFYWFEADQLGLIFLFQLLISICAGAIFPLLWSMYADCADYNELTTGNRATGLIFSSSSMSQKLGWTIGSGVSMWLLAAFGFQPNMAQSPETIDGIKMCLSLLPAVGTVLSVIFISMYPLSAQRVADNAAKLEALRAKKPAES